MGLSSTSPGCGMWRWTRERVWPMSPAAPGQGCGRRRRCPQPGRGNGQLRRGRHGRADPRRRPRPPQRRLRLAADNLLGAEIVLADGRRVTTGPDAEPDLLWALRGGGGNFGVVISMCVRLHPVCDMLAGSVIFTWNEASGVRAVTQRSRRRRPTNLASPSARCPARTANLSSWSCRCRTANGAGASAPWKTCGLSAPRYPRRSDRRPISICSLSLTRE